MKKIKTTGVVVTLTKGHKILTNLVEQRKLKEFVDEYNKRVAQLYGIPPESVYYRRRHTQLSERDVELKSIGEEFLCLHGDKLLNYPMLMQIVRGYRAISDRYKLLLANKDVSPLPIPLNSWNREEEDKVELYFVEPLQKRLYHELSTGRPIIKELLNHTGIGTVEKVIAYVLGVPGFILAEDEVEIIERVIEYHGVDYEEECLDMIGSIRGF
jgi:hypothetical protein